MQVESPDNGRKSERMECCGSFGLVAWLSWRRSETETSHQYRPRRMSKNYGCSHISSGAWLSSAEHHLQYLSYFDIYQQRAVPMVG